MDIGDDEAFEEKFSLLDNDDSIYNDQENGVAVSHKYFAVTVPYHIIPYACIHILCIRLCCEFGHNVATMYIDNFQALPVRFQLQLERDNGRAITTPASFCGKLVRNNDVQDNIDEEDDIENDVSQKDEVC